MIDEFGRTGLKIGGLVFDKKFGGDVAKVKDKNPLKETSLARLAAEGKLKVDPTTLSSWIRAAALARWFENNNNPLNNFTTSHFVALLPLEDEVKRGELAIEANNNGWSVRDLQEKVAAAKEANTPVDWGKKAIAKLGNAKALLKDEALMGVLSSKDALRDKLSKLDRGKIETEIQAVKKALEEHGTTLDGVLGRLLEIRAEIDAAKSPKKVA